jgi:ring-1,2-phenylacetyl-CoA epoxidase subunit PaaD
MAVLSEIYEVLEGVSDPEIPVLSVIDMGIVRDVQQSSDQLTVTITPTYSGCPAMDTIEEDIRKALETAGYVQVDVKSILDPPWTTDWMSEAGRKKLEEYGIAPPVDGSADKTKLFAKSPEIRCPHCKSMNTVRVSQFGSTPCKALYKCNDCLEPFDYFKCI